MFFHIIQNKVVFEACLIRDKMTNYSKRDWLLNGLCENEVTTTMITSGSKQIFIAGFFFFYQAMADQGADEIQCQIYED